MRKIANAFPALIATGAGVALYFAGTRLSWWLVAFGILVPLALGALLLLLGLRTLPSHPRLGVWFIAAWIIGLIAVGAAITTLLAFVGV
jgi:hypothetical protein